MAQKPLHINIRKIDIYNRHREMSARMDAGGPGPMEENFRISERIRKDNELKREIEEAFRKGYQMGLKDG